jgi:outer membrane autotransporter protein
LDDYSGSRHVVFPGVDSTMKAGYSGHQFTAFGTTGYHFYVGDGRTVITPYATLQYTRLYAGGYTETGDPAIDLTVKGQNYDFVQSGLGGKIARDIALSDTQSFRPELHAN